MPSRTATTPRLLIRSSSIHAAGCYTLDPIPRGRRVLEYDGARISKELADERYADRPVTYLFGFGDKGDVIDGFGTAMFLNHSCDPNCRTEEYRRPRLHPRHPRHRRQRGARLRVQPLRLRRRQRRLLLRSPPVPRHHVLRRRSQTPSPQQGPQEGRKVMIRIHRVLTLKEYIASNKILMLHTTFRRKLDYSLAMYGSPVIGGMGLLLAG